MEPIDLIHQHLAAPGLDQIKKKAADPEKEKELKEACAGFEAIFMKKMVESMRSTLPGNALFPQSNTMEIFQSMYDQSLADKLSHTPQSTGLKEFLYQQLKKSL